MGVTVEPFIPFGGPTSYQVRVNLPGGRVIVVGASGVRRDWVRDDMAKLLGVDGKHITVTRIPSRSHRLTTTAKGAS